MSPKTLTGLELDVDDAPARDSELFLVDGNNLAYRAFFALPEELATTDGFPTNALLGFTNMLFKLLSDYKPKGVAVAWDTKPVHRAAVAEAGDVVYKEGRRPMADLLREQFPYFRPIVEAFGYRNLEFEGWEADDVIATLATLADEAGVKTTVVSTDRDAFQLVTGNVALMMTPRGVSDVHVYTPERVEARYGIRPEQIPDFIGLKGDSSDNIPGIPGIGDKTAGQLIAQYGSLEGVIEHAAELSPARKKNVIEYADQARMSKELATMRRDLELDCDPAQLVLSPPDRSELREMFRRFEFRNLLNRIDELDDAVPALERIVAGTEVLWREGELPEQLRGRVGLAIDGDRFALAQDDGVVVGAWSPELATKLRDAQIVAHDYKGLPRLTMLPAEDTMIAAYLIEPGRPAYELDDLAAEYGVEALPEPEPEEETAALVRAAEAPRRLAGPLRERLRERGSEELYDRIELPLTAVLAAMEAAGVKIDTYPDGRDHGAARRPRRGARVAGVRARGRGLHARLDPAGGADSLREARAHAGTQGQDRLFDGHARAPLDPRRPRDRRRDRGVARAEQADEHVPRAAAHAARRGRAPAHDVQSNGGCDGAPLDDEPESPGDPGPDGARSRDPQRLRRGNRPPARVGRLLAGRAAHPRARVG